MGRKRRPFVAVETDVAKDESFAVLADICGISRDEALGKIVRLWAWCADRKLQDAPDGCPGYAVPDAVITRWFGPDGIRGILGDGCEAFALGSRWPGGLIYLRGTDDTVAARRMQLAGARAGGDSRAQGDRDSHGRFVSEDTNSPAVSPAASRVDPRSQIPDPIPETLAPRAHAIPPTAPGPVQGAYDHEDPRSRGRLAEQTYQRIGEARAQLAAELELPAPLPFPPWTPASSAQPISDALARIREEGAAAPAACEHVIAALIAQAREERDLEWLGTKAFTAGGWRHARERIPGAKARHARAGPRGAPVRDIRVGAVQPSDPSLYPDGELPL